MLTDAGLVQNMMLVTLVARCCPQHHIVNQPYVLTRALFMSEGDVCVCLIGFKNSDHLLSVVVVKVYSQ